MLQPFVSLLWRDHDGNPMHHQLDLFTCLRRQHIGIMIIERLGSDFQHLFNVILYLILRTSLRNACVMHFFYYSLILRSHSETVDVKFVCNFKYKYTEKLLVDQEIYRSQNHSTL